MQNRCLDDSNQSLRRPTRSWLEYVGGTALVHSWQPHAAPTRAELSESGVRLSQELNQVAESVCPEQRLSRFQRSGNRSETWQIQYLGIFRHENPLVGICFRNQ